MAEALLTRLLYKPLGNQRALYFPGPDGSLAEDWTGWPGEIGTQ